MSDPIFEREQVMPALRAAAAAAERYLSTIDSDLIRRPGADAAAMSLDATLPEDGDGALVAIDELIRASDGALRNSGPRFFHWVVGGTTPAALAADWLTSTFDQSVLAWDSTPLGTRCEELAIDRLKDVFALPASWGGVLTTGATMANFRRSRPRVGGGHSVTVSTSTRAGSRACQPFPRSRADTSTRARRRRSRCSGSAATPFAASSETTSVASISTSIHSSRWPTWRSGTERAHSVVADGHKWLNVAYDSGFAFVRDASLLDNAFAIGAPYLPRPGEHPMFGGRGPEASRRARGIAIWATLRAYGRAGHRAMVERHLDLAQRLARAVDAAPELERLADVPLNIVCFRYRPGDLSDDALDRLNTKIGADLLADGRVYVGTTRYRGRVAFRPAIVNWRTTEADIDLIVAVVRELGARLAVTVA